MPGQRDEVGVVAALADRRCLLEDPVRGGGTALEQRRQPGRQHQEPALRAVEAVLLDQPLRPRHPAATAGHLPAKEQWKREPEAAARRAGRVAVAEVLVVGLLPGGRAVVVAAGEVGRGREQLQVSGVER